MPRSSTQGISEKGQLIMILVSAVFVLYVALKVKKNLQERDRNKKH